MNGRSLLVTIKLPPKTARAVYIFYIIATLGIWFKSVNIISGIKDNSVAAASKVLDKLYEMPGNCLFANRIM